MTTIATITAAAGLLLAGTLAATAGEKIGRAHV